MPVIVENARESSYNMVKIIITGSPTAENRCEASKNGADADLEKPIEPEKSLWG